MARNLGAKCSPTDTIRLFDINRAAADKLAHEMKTQQAGGAAAEVAASAAAASRDAVCVVSYPSPPIQTPGLV